MGKLAGLSLHFLHRAQSFQLSQGGELEVVFMKDRQINTKMLFVKTKQETVWWFLLLDLIWLWPDFDQNGNM